MNQIRNRVLLPGLVAALAAQVASADPVRVERLTWAGVKFVTADTTVFVDAVGTDLWDGGAPGGLVPVTADTGRRYALVTHAHNDHLDVETLKTVLGDRGYVICHESMATYLASRGLRVISTPSWVPVSRGGFTFTAVPAVDGFGDDQVSWVIATGKRRFLHAGDTLWHGHWRRIAGQFSPFDAVFLPINGVRVSGEPLQETPAVMTPAQAVDAAIALEAKLMVPIHFGHSSPPDYIEADDPLGTARAAASRRGLAFRHLSPGEHFAIQE
ncbi:MAG: MBL fold metallo-hydrolase [Xanthomonadales bacterium]|nr:MBL fold metallo-hydrolase [Xanthomonadales bacterium]